MVAAAWFANLFQARLLDDYAGAIARLDVTPDLSTAGFTLALVFAATLLFGLAPALRASRRDLNAVLKGDAPTWLRRTRLQGNLVVAQIALSLVLLLAGGLFLRKLQQMSVVPLGYDTENVLTLSLDLRGRGRDEAAAMKFYQELRERSSRVPGVISATAPTTVPLGFMYDVNFHEVYVPAGRADAREPAIETSYIGPEFFRTLGTPLLRGRSIDERDVRMGARVAVINESAAQRFWPGEDPIGRVLVNGRKRDQRFEVVGLVRDIRANGVAETPEAHVYTPVTRADLFTENLLVRFHGDAAVVARALRAEIRRLDPTLPVFNVKTLAELAGAEVNFQRVLTTAIAVLGALALALAALGLYGVIAFAVKGRSREISTRMALGARASQVIAVFLRDGLRLTAFGIVVGTMFAVPAGMFISAMFSQTRRFDGMVLVGVALVLAVVALFAMLVPARRATRVDPIVALRAE